MFFSIVLVFFNLIVSDYPDDTNFNFLLFLYSYIIIIIISICTYYYKLVESLNIFILNGTIILAIYFINCVC